MGMLGLFYVNLCLIALINHGIGLVFKIAIGHFLSFMTGSTSAKQASKYVQIAFIWASVVAGHQRHCENGDHDAAIEAGIMHRAFQFRHPLRVWLPSRFRAVECRTEPLRTELDPRSTAADDIAIQILHAGSELGLAQSWCQTQRAAGDLGQIGR